MGAMAMAELAPATESIWREPPPGQAAAGEGKARVIAEIARFSALLDHAALVGQQTASERQQTCGAAA